MSTETRQFIFQGAQSPLTFACHISAVVVALLLIVILSRFERRLISLPLGLGLLCLRISILMAILLTLMQPTIDWTLQETHTGRILVGIDLSSSMATADRHASRGEKLRVARGLEMIGNAANELRLDRWQAAFDGDQQPEWVDPDESQEEARRKLLADSRREQLEAAFREVDKLSRREIAGRLLTGGRIPLLDQIGQSGHVELFAFAGDAESIDRERFEEIVSDPPISLKTETTDLSRALQVDANGTDEVMGIVVVTDGRDHAGKNLAGMAGALKTANIPVYPILVGSKYRPKDLSILLVECPQNVYKGDHPVLKVTLGTVGFEGRTINAELIRSDRPDVEPMTRSVICRGATATVEFQLDAEQPGRRAYVVRTPAQEGETRDDNNSRSFAMEVIDDRAKVLLIDGEARWEFRYLEAALSRDERIQLKTVLFDQPFLHLLPEPYFPNRLTLPVEAAGATSSLAEFDLVIVGDVSGDQLPNEGWQSLLKYVSEGGTLVLSAGTRHMPLMHNSPALKQLLPIINLGPASPADRNEEARPSARGLKISLTPDGDQQPMFQFDSDVDQNTAIWKELPGHSWALLGEAKPNSTVWATTQLPAGNFEGLAADRKFALIVQQFVGSGQVVWIGFHSTWRWRYRVGDKYHHRFWAQLARWAATNKLSAGTDVVRFGPDKVEIEAGQEAKVRARWSRAFLQQQPNPKSRAEFYRLSDKSDQPLLTVDLAFVPGSALEQEGRAPSLPPGEYLIRLVTEQAKMGDKRIESTLLVSEKTTDELNDLSTNRELLEQIAAASGGRLFLPNEVRDLPTMFKKGNETVTRSQAVTLWDRWPWLLLVFSLMTCEWSIRKLNGLP